MRQDQPAARILARDPWYTDSQFRAQMRTRGRRRVIEDRWRVFGSMVDAWRAARGHSGSITMLDAGCGDGINILGLHRLAAELAWPLRLVAMDYNPLRLDRARERVPGLTAQQASLYALPYASGRFDVVLCSHVLEHVPDNGRALSELHRVLTPGGLLIVGVPNEGCAMARLRNSVLQPRIGRTTDHVHFFTASALVARLSANGFRALRLERETFFFPVDYLNMLCAELHAGHVLMALLRRVFPSQAGGLIVAAEKPPAAAPA